ncbi:MAG: hypothetical protein M1818_007662 [Claussenomyces sp. TS43310]|nr:MAG: hypothetical protein M1818_007662 [Claussenomyces sp. TS43310]
MDRPRRFHEITVNRIGYQRARTRFDIPRDVPSPPGIPSYTDQLALYYVSDGSSEDSNDESEEPEQSQPEQSQYLEQRDSLLPPIAEWSMNLTALSQCHNLYFAAYVDKVNVFRLAQQVLTSKADLVMKEFKSTEAHKVGTRSLRSTCHTINRVMVGNLGNEEILLLAFDDGDIVAYYTRAIEEAVLSRSEGPPTDCGKPFFSENVGNGAWGLAIHAQSRLIAVSSNNHEVQVFAFALSSGKHQALFIEGDARFSHFTRKSDQKFAAREGGQFVPRGVDGKPLRDHNLRIVLRPDSICHNIPSIAFAEDELGEAETIVAKDVKGELWLLSIWRGDWMRLPTRPEQNDLRQFDPLGWGVMVLPQNFFKTTRTPPETSTMQEEWFVAIRDRLEDWSQTAFNEGEGVLPHASSLLRSMIPGAEVATSGNVTVTTATSTSPPPLSPSLHADLAHANERQASSAHISSHTEPHPFGLSLIHEAKHHKTTFTTSRFISDFISGSSIIIHTDRHELYLLPSGKLDLSSEASGLGIPLPKPMPTSIARNILRQDFFHVDLQFPRELADYDRLNMLGAIPELSLIVVASQVGRVALCTVTRPSVRVVVPFNRATPDVPRSTSQDTQPTSPLRRSEGSGSPRPRMYGESSCATTPRLPSSSSPSSLPTAQVLSPTPTFRIDAILPTPEEDESIRPSCGLLGIAIAPVWLGKGKQQRSRWKLMLHYHDHTILSYEISREAERGDVMVL